MLGRSLRVVASAACGGYGHTFFVILAIGWVVWTVVLASMLGALLPLQEKQFEGYVEATCTTTGIRTTEAFRKCEQDRQVCVSNTIEVEASVGGAQPSPAEFEVGMCTANAIAVSTEQGLLQDCYQGAQRVGAVFSCFLDPEDASRVAFLWKRGNFPAAAWVSVTPYRIITIVVPVLLLVPLLVGCGAFLFVMLHSHEYTECERCGEFGHEDFQCPGKGKLAAQSTVGEGQVYSAIDGGRGQQQGGAPSAAGLPPEQQPSTAQGEMLRGTSFNRGAPGVVGGQGGLRPMQSLGGGAQQQQQQQAVPALEHVGSVGSQGFVRGASLRPSF